MHVNAERGRGKLVIISVMDAADDPAGLVLETDPALAAADVTIASDEQASTECAAEHVAFTSGSVRPRKGDTISGATSGSTAVVIGCLLSSGTWAGGDAAGTLWVEQASGAFQSENLDNDTTGGTNFATIAGDLTDAAIDSVGTRIGIGLTSSEMACTVFHVAAVDSVTKVYLDTWFSGETLGGPDAEFVTGSNGLLFKTTIAAVASQTDMDLARGPADDGGLPAGTMAIITDQTNFAQKGLVRLTSYDQSDDLRVQFSDTPPFTVAVGDTIEFLAVTPAIGLDGTNLTEAGGNGDHLTEAGGTGDHLVAVGLADGAITAAKIASDAITAAKIASSAITADKIASNAITATKIATDAITAAKIAADAIGASELAADAVTEIVAGIFARTYDATDMSSITFEEMTAMMACALLGKASGLDTTTAVYRNLADAADALSATVDADGNRSAVTLTLAAVR